MGLPRGRDAEVNWAGKRLPQYSDASACGTGAIKRLGEPRKMALRLMVARSVAPAPSSNPASTHFKILRTLRGLLLFALAARDTSSKVVASTFFHDASRLHVGGLGVLKVIDSQQRRSVP